MVLNEIFEREEGSSGILTVSVFIMLLTVATMLFTKYTVSNLQREVDGLTYEINKNKQDYHVFQAEWTYLTSPKRIEILASAYLEGNREINAEQLKNLKKLDNYYLAKGKANSKRAFAMNKTSTQKN